MTTTKPKAPEALPITFDEELHQYTWAPTGETMAYSVTEIVGFGKRRSCHGQDRSHRSVWEPAAWRSTAPWRPWPKAADPIESLLGTEYDAWIKPLVEHPIWEFSEVLASSFVCAIGAVPSAAALTCCCGTASPETILIDLKTQGRSGRPYDTSAQLGGYVAMSIDRLGLVVDGCHTLWARPGETKLGEDRGGPLP